MLSGERGTRASDQDRERAAAALGGHYAAGRLTLEEFQERLDQAYAAKTLGELDDLTTDLPGTDLGQGLDIWSRPPGGNPPLPGRRAPGPVQAHRSHDAIVRFCVAVTIGVFVIWLISGAGAGLWFLWAAVLLTALALRRWIMGGTRRDRDHHHHYRDHHQHRDHQHRYHQQYRQ